MDPEPDPTDEEGKVLSPQELELANKDGVEQLEEGRFVVSPDGTDPDVPTELSVDGADVESSAREQSVAATSAEPAAEEPATVEAESPRLDRTSIQDWHEQQLSESPSAYGYHLSLKAGSAIDHHTIHSDDVTMTFNNLLLWYARTVDGDLPPGAVIGILLSDASVPVQFPVKALEQFVMDQGLSTEDSIADLLEAVRDDGGIVFPPRTE
ncbi:DUF7500 family protein [Salinarchaeum laminariae]|uniref:DUF7500 family protein n=1 Tax=Salinarchaeum laminariae TaxID=869888 RepID=UPI0020BD78A9|nr:hypothetical protein [Salinarchaeum laminariae]